MSSRSDVGESSKVKGSSRQTILKQKDELSKLVAAIEGASAKLGGNLQFVPPQKVAGQAIYRMRSENVPVEAAFWESSVACFVLGSNPPVWLMEANFKKLWVRLGIDNVICLPSGIFVVREVERVPMWIQLHGLTIGYPITAYEFTCNWDRIQYARILVDMEITDSVPDKIVFEDEHGNVRTQKVGGSVIKVKRTHPEWRKVTPTKTLELKEKQPVEILRKDMSTVDPLREVVSKVLEVGDSQQEHEIDKGLQESKQQLPM
ncbi:OLC1v1008068C1 [Oldenlandia corymbosa var. corymbosa]|uniref:OLC1v1008068C1 n=1 Tax=Oldenlandia corymbosa var. corymbosa TaxID=529605 RepID=A0AAV1DKX9_OLDCO|nr:OLC1v1008068C1 [Oldenlandia corymbosa var. corymbosa]